MTGKECVKLKIKFSTQCKSLREERKLTLEELSKRTQVSIEKLTAYENGTSIPSNETILKLSNALEVPVSNLMDGLRNKRLGDE